MSGIDQSAAAIKSDFQGHCEILVIAVKRTIAQSLNIRLASCWISSFAINLLVNHHNSPRPRSVLFQIANVLAELSANQMPEKGGFSEVLRVTCLDEVNVRLVNENSQQMLGAKVGTRRQDLSSDSNLSQARSTLLFSITLNYRQAVQRQFVLSAESKH
jgi:hypothetical protein